MNMDDEMISSTAATATGTPPTPGGGSLVADGKHSVPPGVAVEELGKYSGHKKLRDECPPELDALLRKKNSFDVYDQFVKAVVETSNTRKWNGTWNDQEFIGILDLFAEDFAEHDLKVVYCKRSSSGGSHRWIEYIDVIEAPGYVAQYDMSNLSGQTIKTCYTTLTFPNGVAVEEIKRYGKNKRQKLKERCPPAVEKMMSEHNLMEVYMGMVTDMADTGVGRKLENWNLKKLNEISVAWSPRFEANGVKVYVSHKEEYISHGQGGHYEYFRWLEFVDTKVQPNYQPQRDANSKDQKCIIS